MDPRDHPRVRGEQQGTNGPNQACTGSSPRARGTAGDRLLYQPVTGIIPACAGNSPPCARCCAGTRDHPRVRGEQIISRYMREPSPGSSPRARGTEDDVPEFRITAGIIPACAGNSSPSTARRHPERDHPRVRGEQLASAFNVEYAKGSSPRARGTACQLIEAHAVVGIIPACAGNRPRPRPARRRWRDHPRVRGEQAIQKSNPGFDPGSSPRARGTAESPCRSASDLRIIPACAGNSLACRTRCRCYRDHPRVRGEQSTTRPRRSSVSGSSPRARGTGHPEEQPGIRPGIIPACAGNRWKELIWLKKSRDHPRVRGEQLFSGTRSIGKAGSSPRARGTGCVTVKAGCLPGIIPACAGNRDGCIRISHPSRDHPRVRGEQSSSRKACQSLGGSSPRARGTDAPRAGNGSNPGIIPACAGNSLNNQRRLLTQNDITFTFQEEETQPAALSCLASAKFARFSELAS